MNLGKLGLPFEVSQYSSENFYLISVDVFGYKLVSNCTNLILVNYNNYINQILLNLIISKQ